MKTQNAWGWFSAGLLAAATGVAAADSDPDAGLQEIVVTAQKRQENLTQVPISISVVTPEALQATAAKNLTQLQGVVPGVTFQGDRSYGGTNIAMRGTSGATTPLQDDPVAVYVDGVYVPPSYFGVTSLSDIGSIEIVRGPQGTLQGRNATAGAILVHTADPQSTFGGYAHVSGADPEQFRAEVALTGPLAPDLSGRVSVDRIYDRGWAHNGFNDTYLGGSSSTLVRGVLLWNPNRFRARLGLSYLKYTTREALAAWANNDIHPTGQAITQPHPGNPLTDAQRDAIEDGHFYQDLPSGYTMEAATGSLELSYDFDDMQLVSVSGANRYSTNGTTDSSGLALLPRAGYNVGMLNNNFLSEELRLQSSGKGPFKWLFGGYVSKSNSGFNFDIYNLQFTVPTNGLSAFSAKQGNPSAAGFLDLSYNILPKLSIGGGVRYTNESKTFRNSFASISQPSGITVVGPLYFNPPKKTWTDTSYRGIVNYTPTDDSLVYASYSKGFKSGGFNAFTVGHSDPYNPETLKSVEVGAKADLLDRRVHLGAATYRNSYENLQVSSGVPSGGVVINNAGKATIKGVELEAKARVIDHWTLEINGAFTDGVYDTFANTPNIFGVLVNASGHNVTSTPRWQYFTQATYDFELGSQWTGLAQLNWRWRDKLYFSATDQNVANFQSDKDGELGARLRFEQTSWQFWAAVYGVNLNDKRVTTSEALAFSNPLVSLNRPRTIGLEVGKEF